MWRKPSLLFSTISISFVTGHTTSSVYSGEKFHLVKLFFSFQNFYCVFEGMWKRFYSVGKCEKWAIKSWRRERRAKKKENEKWVFYVQRILRPSSLGFHFLLSHLRKRIGIFYSRLYYCALVLHWKDLNEMLNRLNGE